MIDPQTRESVLVSTPEDAGPFIRTTVRQLGQVRAVLDEHGIRYWVESTAISIGGKPAIAFINLGRHGDPALVQEILDLKE